MEYHRTALHKLENIMPEIDRKIGRFISIILKFYTSIEYCFSFWVSFFNLIVIFQLHIGNDQYSGVI